MTANEKKQPNSVFVQAGKDAFAIGVHVLQNPYTLQPYRTLWEKGHRNAKRQYEEARFAAQRREANGEEGSAPVPAAANPAPKKPYRKPFAKPQTRPQVSINTNRVYRPGTIGAFLSQSSIGPYNAGKSREVR